MKYLLIVSALILPLLIFGTLGSGEEATLEKATFAGGCFWCIEAPFEKLEGIKEVVSGYTGGTLKNPTYQQVGTGSTGHIEAVQITFDPEKISYRELLTVFWRQFDPTDAGGSFGDRGPQYTSAIFFHTEEQEIQAKASKKELAASGIFDKTIVTPIRPAETLYPAEDYHQDYYKKNPVHYQRYRTGSGRDQFIQRVWGTARARKFLSNNVSYQKPSREVLMKQLTPLQYQVTQEDGTEPPFNNEYWDNKREGIYVDIVSGEPLFSSRDKFKSGTGWPSFTRPLVKENVVEKADYKLMIPRTEVRSKHGDSHLGHLFNDGPQPTGLRYCINSAALRFIPKEELEKNGYKTFAKLF